MSETLGEKQFNEQKVFQIELKSIYKDEICPFDNEETQKERERLLSTYKKLVQEKNSKLKKLSHTIECLTEENRASKQRQEEIEMEASKVCPIIQSPNAKEHKPLRLMLNEYEDFDHYPSRENKELKQMLTNAQIKRKIMKLNEYSTEPCNRNSFLSTVEVAKTGIDTLLASKTLRSIRRCMPTGIEQ